MIPQIPDSVIADTAAAVFAADEYARARPSLLARAYQWVLDFFAPLGEATTPSAPIFWSVIAAAMSR